MSADNEIILKIDGDMDPTHLPLNEMLHRKDFERVMGLIEDSLKKAEDYCKRLEKNKGCKELQTRRHDTILISGVRGSGKTTFMLSIKNRVKGASKSSKCEKEGSQSGEEKFGFLSDIISLGILDPTLIESKEHVFTNILSRICELVHEKAKRTNCFATSSCCNEESKDGDYNVWKKSLEKLADGLKAMDGIGDENLGDGWMDSELLMERGVRYGGAANRLELNFHLFINKSLNFLGKKAFILFLDDVDTNFGMGQPVLDVLHKYFTTPQLITVLSGDLKLYATLVRGRQWKNYSKIMLKMETELAKEKNDIEEAERRRKGFQGMVSHLEQQYLLKLLRSDRRAFLSSAYQRLQEKEVIKLSADRLKEIKIENAYDILFRSIGVENASEQRFFFRFAASQPIRTQKQIFAAGLEILRAGELENNGVENEHGPEKFLSAITDIFWTDLWEKRVDVSALRNSAQLTTVIALNYLTENNILAEGYTFRPAFEDDIVNACQFALGSVLRHRMVNDPSIAFEYMIRIGLSREIQALIDEREDGFHSKPTLKDYLQYCTVNVLSRGAAHVARLQTVYLRAILNHRSKNKDEYAHGTWHGTMPLYAFEEVAKKGDSDRIDTVRKGLHENSVDYVLVGLPVSAGTDHKGSTIPLVSFYNLLGVITEVLGIAVASLPDKRVDAISELLIRSSQYREYPFPSWIGALQADEVGPSETEEVSPEKKYEGLAELAKSLKEWAEKGIGVVGPQTTATVLGRVMTRFFFGTNRMDSELSPDTNLGGWLHSMTVLFLNSVLVEEAIYSNAISKEAVSMNNPVKDSSKLTENLSNISDFEEIFGGPELHYKFSKFIFECPLWHCYINYDGDVKLNEQIQKFIDIKSLYTNNNVYGALSRVKIRHRQAKAIKAKQTNAQKSEKIKFDLKNIQHMRDLAEAIDLLEKIEVIPDSDNQLANDLRYKVKMANKYKGVSVKVAKYARGNFFK